MLQVKRRGRLVSARREVAEQNRIRNAHERRLSRQLASLFDKIADQVVEDYQSGGPSAVRTDGILRMLSDILVPHYRSIIISMADRFQTVKVKRENFEQLVQYYLRNKAGTNIVNVSQTTINQVRRVISDVDKEALGPKAVAKAIKERIGGAFGRRRAFTIARTETHSAASFANHEVAKSFNIPMRKQWVSTNDERTRSWHSAINGQTVDIDEDFIVPYKGVDYRMKHAGDPAGGPANVINCRCVIIYLEPEDVVIDDQPKLPPEKLPEQKPLIDINPLVQELTRGSAGADAFTKKLNDALTPLTAALASKLPMPKRIIESKNAGWYDNGEIKSHLEYGTLEHEYGHHIDAELGRSLRLGYNEYWSEEGLRDAWDIDRKANKLHKTAERDDSLKRFKDELFDTEEYEVRGFKRNRLVTKFDGATEVSDIIDSMVGGYFRNNYRVFGHSQSYWQRGGSKQRETFANLYSLQNKPQALAFIKKNFPELQRRFENAMQEFVDTGAIS